MAVFQEARNADVVAAAKISTDGLDISRQRRDIVMDIDALIETNRKAPTPVVVPAVGRQ